MVALSEKIMIIVLLSENCVIFNAAKIPIFALTEVYHRLINIPIQKVLLTRQKLPEWAETYQTVKNFMFG